MIKLVVNFIIHFGNLVMNNLRRVSFGSELYNQLGNQLSSELYDQLYGRFGGRLWDQLWNQFHRKLLEQLNSKLKTGEFDA